jgi:UDP-N-acetylglucosamine diphosphorylase/glucosamine-1-phosphate N-acetyltransferase
MKIILTDINCRTLFLPLTFNKAVADLRLGYYTLQEWWQVNTACDIYIHTAAYLINKYETIKEDEYIVIDASVVYSEDIWQQIKNLPLNHCLADENGFVAGRFYVTATAKNLQQLINENYNVNKIDYVNRIESFFHLLTHQQQIIQQQFIFLKSYFTNKEAGNAVLINQVNIIIGNHVRLENCTINATEGEVIIGNNVLIMDGACIRGPLVIGDNTVVKMGATIYGATTIGQNCTVGGEIKNSIIQDYSNKAHHGYMGDSIIGAWCNWGAGTSNSNVKNTASTVKVHNYATKHFITAGNKFGVVMADYCKLAINSSINTGSSYGICNNIFGNGLLPKYLQNFTWGIAEKYIFDKAINDIENWMNFKGRTLTDIEKQILQHIYNL